MDGATTGAGMSKKGDGRGNMGERRCRGQAEAGFDRISCDLSFSSAHP